MKKSTLIYLLLLIFALPYSNLAGQDTETNYLISSSGDTVNIKAIPLPVITDSIEQAFNKLKIIEGHLVPNVDLEQFDSIYQARSVELDKEKTKILDADDHSSIREIDDNLREWTEYNKILTDHKDQINSRIQILETDDFQLKVLIQTWELTLNSAKEGGLPADVLTNLTDFISRAKKVQKDVVAAKTDAFRKQNKITELLLMVDEVDSSLTENRTKLQSDYFNQDSPPIWDAVDSTASPGQLKGELKIAIKSIGRSLENFYYTNENLLIIHLLIFILLWFGFFYLHKQASEIEGIEDNEYLNQSMFLLSRYAISALIVSLFLSIWLYPTVSTAVGDLIQLLYILIAIYFLPRYVNKKLNIVLYAVLVLFLFNEVQVFFPGKTFFSRINLIIEGIIAFWILVKMVSKKYVIADQLERRNWGVLLKIVPIFFVLLVVAFFSNIFGLLNLSLLLTNTVVNALFNLIILILFVIVLNRTLAILLRTPFMQSSNIIKDNLPLVEKRLSTLIHFGSVFLWIRSVLILVGVWDIVENWFSGLLSTKWEVGTSTIELGSIFYFFLAITITILVYRGMKALLKDEIFPRVTLPRGVPGAISMIIGYLIAGYGIFISISLAGVDLSSFGLIAGALGVGIGFGLQGIVANFIAGLVISFERPIQVGDTIEIDNLMGDVKSIGVRSSTIRTFSGSEVIVPNSSLITNDVINWTLSDRRKRRDIIVSTAYGSNPHVVLELLERVANEHPDVLKVPAPWAIFDGFGDSSLNFRIRIWTTMDNGVTTKSSVAINIYDALHVAGIEIPFPQRDLHLRSIDPDIQSLTTSKPKPAPKKIKVVPKTKPVTKTSKKLKIEDDSHESDDD